MTPPSALAPAASDATAALPLANQPSPTVALAEEISRREPHNMLLLALYDVVLRVGWIFKTESVIMPAFLDTVAGAGWLRGCLPIVNRFGQSVPPALYAPRLRALGLKKFSLAVWTLGMGLAFLALAAAWLTARNGVAPSWMAAFFLVVYGIFSCCHGINHLSYSTLQGKLIRFDHRGRLMALALPTGSVMAILFAWWLMGDWLRLPSGGFTYIFGFTGVCFVLSAVIALTIAEPRDGSSTSSKEPNRPFRAAWGVLTHDRNFRRLAVVAMLAGSATVLFPHYQAMARERLNLAGANLMVWVVVQNAAVGVFGLLLGWVLDRCGERLCLRLSLFGAALAPLAALVIVSLGPALGREWFWLIFIPLGMTPITMKTMIGYTLEIAPGHEHPRYLSTLSLCLAVPFCFSPLVGWLVDVTSFEAVFCAGAMLILLAAALTFRLYEPRHHLHALVDTPLPTTE